MINQRLILTGYSNGSATRWLMTIQEKREQPVSGQSDVRTETQEGWLIQSPKSDHVVFYSGSLIGYSSDDTRMHHPQKEMQELPRLIKISRTPSLFSLFVLLLVSGLSLMFWLIIWMTLTLFLGQCTDWWQIHESNSTNCSPNSVHDVSRKPWNCLVSHVACEQPSVQLDNVLIL